MLFTAYNLFCFHRYLDQFPPNHVQNRAFQVLVTEHVLKTSPVPETYKLAINDWNDLVEAEVYSMTKSLRATWLSNKRREKDPSIPYVYLT